MIRTVLAFMLLLQSSMLGHAQYLTSNTFHRVKKIAIGATTGTAFTMEVDGRQYLVTAKHVIAALKGEQGEISIFEGRGKFEKIKVKVLRCADPVDIAVLVPEKQLTVAYPLPPVDGKLILSQDVFFIGFPYGDDALSTVMEDAAIGFVRKATFAAQERKDGWILYYLDGINSAGFSGSPVVFQDFQEPNHPWQIMAVVSGYRNDLADVVRIMRITREEITDVDRAASRIVKLQDGSFGRLVPTGDIVLNNSGIVRAYGIKSAVDLIKSSGVEGPEAK